jgi:hypothetical protein
MSEPSGSSTELMFEYDQLRKEILHNDELTVRIMQATIALAGAATTVAFSEAITADLAKALLFLMGEVISFIGLWQTIDRSRTTFVLASYIRTFIEPRTGTLKYETRLHRFRSHQPRVGYRNILGYQVTTYGAIILFNYLLSAAFIYTGLQSPFLTYSVIGLVTIVTLGALVKAIQNLFRFVYNHVQTIQPVWQTVKDEELGHTNQVASINPTTD